MDENRMNHFRHLLNQHKEDHEKTLTDMLHLTLGEYGPNDNSELSRYDNHPADGATDITDATQYSALIGNEKFEMAEINDALEKIRQNAYGRCETCGNDIDEERLEFLPQARNCIQCERLHEEENKHDKFAKSLHRPVEEDVLEKEMRGEFLHEMDSDEPYEGKQALEEVLTFGSSDTPQDGGYLGNETDEVYNGKDIHEIDDVEQVSNEMYLRQL